MDRGTVVAILLILAFNVLSFTLVYALKKTEKGLTNSRSRLGGPRRPKSAVGYLLSGRFPTGSHEKKVSGLSYDAFVLGIPALFVGVCFLLFLIDGHYRFSGLSIVESFLLFLGSWVVGTLWALISSISYRGLDPVESPQRPKQISVVFDLADGFRRFLGFRRRKRLGFLLCVIAFVGWY
jgi:hypothetical protein